MCNYRKIRNYFLTLPIFLFCSASYAGALPYLLDQKSSLNSRNLIKNPCDTEVTKHNVLSSVVIKPNGDSHYKLKVRYHTGDGYTGKFVTQFKLNKNKNVIHIPINQVLKNSSNKGRYLLKDKLKISTATHHGNQRLLLVSKPVGKYCIKKPKFKNIQNETVVILGPGTGEESEAINLGFHKLEQETGLKVQYVGTFDFFEYIEFFFENGPPLMVPDPHDPENLLSVDIIYFNVPTVVQSAVDLGLLEPLSKMNKHAALANYRPGYITLGTFNGKQHTAMHKIDLKSMVWYNKKIFRKNGYSVPTSFSGLQDLTQEMIHDGQVPWCFGNGAGDFATGFPFTDWLEDILLTIAPATLYDQWVKNQVGFNHPKVIQAWYKTLSIINKNGAVFERTSGDEPAFFSFADSILNLVSGDAKSPHCAMHKMASFVPSVWRDDPMANSDIIKDIDFFVFPGKQHNRYKSQARDTLLISGLIAGALKQEPHTKKSAAVERTMHYILNPDYPREIQRGFKSINGGYYSGFASAMINVNLKGNVGNTPIVSPIERKLFHVLANANDVRFDASDLMPEAIGATGYPSFDVELTNPIDNMIGSCQGVDTSEFPLVESCFFWQPATSFWANGTYTIIGADEFGNPREIRRKLYFPDFNDTFLSIWDLVGQSIEDAADDITAKFCQIEPGNPVYPHCQ